MRQLQGAGGGGGGGGGGSSSSSGGGSHSHSRPRSGGSGGEAQCEGPLCVAIPILMFLFVLGMVIFSKLRNLSWRGVPSHKAWLAANGSTPGDEPSGGRTSLLPFESSGGRWSVSSCFRADRDAAMLIEHHDRRVARVGAPVGSCPTGNFVGLYWQHGRAHPIPAQTLECRPSSAAEGCFVEDLLPWGMIAGGGYDDVGSFNVLGSYSSARVALTKRYVRGTGNPNENKGHSVELRLQLADLHASSPERAHDLRLFGCPEGSIGYFGSWHVRTGQYRGDAEMALWLPPVPVAVGYLVTPSTSSAAPVGLPVCAAAPSGGNADAANADAAHHVPVGLPPAEDLEQAGGVVQAVPIGDPVGADAVEMSGGAAPGKLKLAH